MTPRNLFNLIIKICGIFFIKDILIFLTQVIIALIPFDHYKASFEWTTLGTLIILIISTSFIYLLIFKTNFIIDKLKLTEGFDQEIIPLNMHRSSILSIAIIVIGTLLIVNQLPNFLSELFEYLRLKKETISTTGSIINHSIVNYSITAVIKIFIGLLLIIYQRHIVNFIEYKRIKISED